MLRGLQLQPSIAGLEAEREDGTWREQNGRHSLPKDLLETGEHEEMLWPLLAWPVSSSLPEPPISRPGPSLVLMYRRHRLQGVSAVTVSKAATRRIAMRQTAQNLPVEPPSTC